MTILPKKNNTRKNEQDDDNDNRQRQRNRNIRNNRHPSHPAHHTRDDFDYDELGTGIDNSVVPSLSSPMYGDIENRDAHEGLPHKRSRHIQGSPYYLASSSPPTHSNSRVTSREESPIGEGETEDGYNSSDEHGPAPTGGIEDRAVSKGPEESEDHTQQEEDFERELREKKGFTIKQMATDGACMFRAVADQVYGDQEMHTVVRRHCMDYMVQNTDFFSQYITEDFASYIRRKRREHSHGNHIEMQALSEMYNRPIEVYQYSIVPINTFSSRTHNSDDNPPMRLSYHGSVHYNSVVDPYNPTVGVGLGLAGYKPGVEDQGVLNKATQESEALLLEQAMLEDKIKATDWEATDEQLAELATRESYLQWLRDNQRSTNNAGASSSTSTSTQSKRMSPAHEGLLANLRRSPPHVASTSRRSPPRETKRSPPRESHVRTHAAGGGGSSPINKFAKQAEASSSCPSLGSSSTPTEPPQPQQQQQRKSPERDLRGPSSSSSQQHWNYDFDYDTNWDNDPVLAAVLAQSQQEYLEWFSRPSNSSSSASDNNNTISNNNNNNNSNNNNDGDSGANTSASSENTDDGVDDSAMPSSATTNNNSNM